MSVNVDDLSFSDLIKLKSQVEAALVKRKELERTEAIAKIKALANASGFTLEELVKTNRNAIRTTIQEGVQTDKRFIVEPKYVHPDDSSLTWTGRGKPPRWLADLEQQGHDRTEFAIIKS